MTIASNADAVGDTRIEGAEVAQVREIINHTFSLYAGPIANELMPAAYSEWLDRGHLRVSSLRKYVHYLADYLPSAEEKQDFINEATMCIVTRALDGKHAYL